MSQTNKRRPVARLEWTTSQIRSSPAKTYINCFEGYPPHPCIRAPFPGFLELPVATSVRTEGSSEEQTAAESATLSLREPIRAALAVRREHGLERTSLMMSYTKWSLAALARIFSGEAPRGMSLRHFGVGRVYIMIVSTRGAAEWTIAAAASAVDRIDTIAAAAASVVTGIAIAAAASAVDRIDTMVATMTTTATSAAAVANSWISLSWAVSVEAIYEFLHSVLEAISVL